MPIRTSESEGDGKALDPERLLIAAIVRQALIDARAPSPPGTSVRSYRQIQQEAREFLADPERLGWFCDLAGLDLAEVLTKLETRIHAWNTPSSTLAR